MTEIQQLWEMYKSTDAMINMLMRKLEVEKYLMGDILDMMSVLAHDDTISQESRTKMLEIAQRAQTRLEQVMETTKLH